MKFFNSDDSLPRCGCLSRAGLSFSYNCISFGTNLSIAASIGVARRGIGPASASAPRSTPLLIRLSFFLAYVTSLYLSFEKPPRMLRTQDSSRCASQIEYVLFLFIHALVFPSSVLFPHVALLNSCKNKKTNIIQLKSHLDRCALLYLIR